MKSITSNMVCFLITIFSFSILSYHVSAQNDSSNVSSNDPRMHPSDKVFEGIKHCTMDKLFCIPANYSKYVPPILTSKTAKPLNVFIGLDNFEILKIDDRDFTVEINAYLIVKWNDKRILVDFSKKVGRIWSSNPIHDQSRTISMMPEEGYIPPEDERDPVTSYSNGTAYFSNEALNRWLPVELELVGKLWLPDSEILRLKSFHSLSVLDRLQGLWMTLRHGILFVVATRIRFMCPMNYAKFPMDVQTCRFQIGSFNYDNTKMRYHTDFLPTMPNNTESILDYDVSIVQLLAHETYYLPAETGNYSVAGFRMVLTRKISHYIITYYLPSGLFVVVSWASFLIPSDDIQGRMALLVTLFLVLVNIFNAITTNSPKADGLNALQAWVITCIFFVFGALSEYAIILLQVKIRNIRGSHGNAIAKAPAAVAIPNGSNPSSATLHFRTQPMLNDSSASSSSSSATSQKLSKTEQLMARLDITCLVVFPVLFLIFALIYGLCVQFL